MNEEVLSRIPVVWVYIKQQESLLMEKAGKYLTRVFRDYEENPLLQVLRTAQGSARNGLDMALDRGGNMTPSVILSKILLKEKEKSTQDNTNSLH